MNQQTNQLEKNEYFFTCNFTWWVFHLIFPLTDEIEDKLSIELIELADELDLNSEELAEWYLEEGQLAGNLFKNDSSINVSIYDCVIQYESNIQSSIEEINQYVEKHFKEKYFEALFLCHCIWLSEIIMLGDNQIGEMDTSHFQNSYDSIRAEKNQFQDWLENSINVLNEKLSLDRTEFNKILSNQNKNWLQLIKSATDSHTIPST
ncbi:MAG: hypothetical protein ACJASQ_004320 [Crocinitomicaceae bacterium]|jgi:hypothetical protein